MGIQWIILIVTLIVIFSKKAGNNPQKTDKKIAAATMDRVIKEHSAPVVSQYSQEITEPVAQYGTEEYYVTEKKSRKKRNSTGQERLKPAAAKRKDTALQPYSEIAEELCYGQSIFDDFAASDALYLARKDAEKRGSHTELYTWL